MSTQILYATGNPSEIINFDLVLECVDAEDEDEVDDRRRRADQNEDDVDSPENDGGTEINAPEDAQESGSEEIEAERTNVESSSSDEDDIEIIREILKCGRKVFRNFGESSRNDDEDSEVGRVGEELNVLSSEEKFEIAKAEYSSSKERVSDSIVKETSKIDEVEVIEVDVEKQNEDGEQKIFNEKEESEDDNQESEEESQESGDEEQESEDQVQEEKHESVDEKQMPADDKQMPVDEQNESEDETEVSEDGTEESGDETEESKDETVVSEDETVASGGETVESEDVQLESKDAQVESKDVQLESEDETEELEDETEEFEDETEEYEDETKGFVDETEEFDDETGESEDETGESEDVTDEQESEDETGESEDETEESEDEKQNSAENKLAFFAEELPSEIPKVGLKNTLLQEKSNRVSVIQILHKDDHVKATERLICEDERMQAHGGQRKQLYKVKALCEDKMQLDKDQNCQAWEGKEVQEHEDSARYLCEHTERPVYGDTKCQVLEDQTMQVIESNEKSAFEDNTYSEHQALNYSQQQSPDYSWHQALDYSQHQAHDYSWHQALDYSQYQALDYNQHQALDFSQYSALDYSRYPALDYSRYLGYSHHQTPYYNQYRALRNSRRQPLHYNQYHIFDYGERQFLDYDEIQTVFEDDAMQEIGNPQTQADEANEVPVLEYCRKQVHGEDHDQVPMDYQSQVLEDKNYAYDDKDKLHGNDKEQVHKDKEPVCEDEEMDGDPEHQFYEGYEVPLDQIFGKQNYHCMQNQADASGAQLATQPEPCKVETNPVCVEPVLQMREECVRKLMEYNQKYSFKREAKPVCKIDARKALENHVRKLSEDVARQMTQEYEGDLIQDYSESEESDEDEDAVLQKLDKKKRLNKRYQDNSKKQQVWRKEYRKKFDVIDCVITDIEGTTTASSFVQDIVFKFVRKFFPYYIREHWNEDILMNDIKEMITLSKLYEAENIPGFCPVPERKLNPTAEELARFQEALVLNYNWLIEHRPKSRPLKKLQGHVVADGYRNGEIIGHVFEDVRLALEILKKGGVKVCTYSNGSIFSQRLLFHHSTCGNLENEFDIYFDTSIGDKDDSASYTYICETFSLKPECVVFFTDYPPEALAAKKAGLRVILMARDRDAPLEALKEAYSELDDVVSSFLDVLCSADSQSSSP